MNKILDDFTPEALASAIETSAVEGCKAWDAWPELELHEDADMMWTLTDNSFPLFNNVFGANMAPDQVDAGIEKAVARARDRNVSLMWWTGPTTRPADIGERLLAKGFKFAGQATGMAADLRAIDFDPPAPQGLRIEEVLDTKALIAWSRVMVPAMGFPEIVRDPWCEMHAAMGLGPGRPWRHFLGYLHGKPVATSSLYMEAGAACLANVSTAPHACRNGIGTALTLEALRTARDAGLRIGVLFSSEMAVNLYTKLGFKKYCEGKFYMWLKKTF